MRLLIVYPYWTYPEVAIEFLMKIAERGHEIIAIKAGDNIKKVIAHKIDNVIIYDVQNLNLSFNVNIVEKYPYFINFDEVLRGIEFDILIIQLPLFLSSIQALKIGKKLRKPMVTEVHGLYANRNLIVTLVQKIYLRSIGLKMFREVDLIRCVNKTDACEIARYGISSDKIRVIPNAVNTDLFVPSENKDEKTLFWSGRMVPEKGLKYLLKALYILQKSGYKDVRLIMAGDGPERFKIINLIRKYQLTNNVRMLGHVPRKILAKYLSLATIFVFPSLREGMPIALFEALASGLPSVCTDVPGIKDYITHGYNALLVPPKNPEIMADAIAMLLEDRILRRKLSENARKYVITNFSYQKIIPVLEKFYEEVSRGIR